MHPVFNNIFTANILGIWEKRVFTPYAGVLPPIEPVFLWTIPEKKQTGRRGLRTNFFENLLEFLGFSFTPGNSKQDKASPIEIPQNCVTPDINFKA